ncbi:hypothetical protein BGZ70_000577 [Mortierella alpina]|uniref:ubiquitinyl hydrolase 1 n=1 Tax=Mortierella alpina TaxID=64518 RepID=A0A9P6IXZ3_MORAP|nr:hypothetical protein BGZ70_000577 [Mortierella alpina]
MTEFRFEAMRNQALHTLHHSVLTWREASDTVENEGDGDDDDVDPSGNHLIVILPYQGRVWEIDSLDEQGPFLLGDTGANWTAVARDHLQQWRFHSTQAVDIHAIYT